MNTNPIAQDLEIGVLHFQDGIFGFENIHEYKLISQNEQHSVLCLNPIEGEVPSFVVIDPYAILDDYSPILSDTDLAFFNVKDQSELKYLVIAVIKEDFKQTVVNLKSPIAINPINNNARQVIVENGDYAIRYNIFKDTKEV